ncbi:uncharacterized protein LOC128954338 [Oppia nitens]|uniref:uncharacterized protein LOC128954338 n=1 Tax=Oppia nitens TaxID=1686743 RepID=UPI0023DA530F|nr:uncharacterized protein LOC128954338 [Oppia nitens]
MLTNYYEKLDINRKASQLDVRKAFRRLALRYHPDKATTGAVGDTANGGQQFRDILEAYRVLSDPNKRKSYDRSLSPPTTTTTPPKAKHRRQDTRSSRRSSGGRNHHQNKQKSSPTAEAAARKPTVHTLYVSLADLMTGCTKRYKISRNLWPSANSQSSIISADYVTIDVKPGWKSGTRITFAEHGDQPGYGQRPLDVVFVICEQPDKQFRRSGNDLLYSCQLTLRDAMSEHGFRIPTLSSTGSGSGGSDSGFSGKPLAHIVMTREQLIKFYENSSVEIRKVGLGLPDHKNRDIRGDLIINCTLKTY